MNRRDFLKAAIAAPYVVRSGVLMPVKQIITVPPVWMGFDIAVADSRTIFHLASRDFRSQLALYIREIQIDISAEAAMRRVELVFPGDARARAHFETILTKEAARRG